MPGPPPKRSDERRRVNTPAAGDPRILDIDALPDLPFKIKREITPPAPGDDWHPMVEELWESFAESGSAFFWEPSDWHMARLMCESLSRDLAEQVVGVTPTGQTIYAEIPLKGASLNAYAKLAAMLMLTEADRRKAGLEIKRKHVADRQEVADVVSLPDRRAQLAGEGCG